jgi:hypothetical protein
MSFSREVHRQETDLSNREVPLGQKLEHVLGPERVVQLDLEILYLKLGVVKPLLESVMLGCKAIREAAVSAGFATE